MSVASISSSTPPSGPLIDPTRQAEYPILLGEKLAGNQESRLINVTYNHKSKSATPHQRATITRSSTSRDIYHLTIKDKAGNAEQTTLTYSYRGSVDPASSGSESNARSLVLVFDPQRKAFVLEPVTAQLNFNLRSGPGKSEKQVLEQYQQLNTLLEDDQASGDDRLQGSVSEDEEPGPADDDNPYDYRHFLPKAGAGGGKPGPEASPTRDPHSLPSKTNTPFLPVSAEPKPKSLPKAKPLTDPLRHRKRVAEPAVIVKTRALPATRGVPRSAPRVQVAPESPRPDGDEDARTASGKLAASPGSNIIIDGDLIIDMGSPPPSRPTFKVNPAHFSSNNTSANEADADGEDDDEIDYLQLPSPARKPGAGSAGSALGGASEDEPDDDDPLAAEMEAAFEESAREEEEARTQQLQQHHQQRLYRPASEDESEVSEEE
jgi:RNA polymerase II transcription elongation factor